MTTLLRKAGYTYDEVYSVNGEGHAYNLVLLPGEGKYHYVDTTGNGKGIDLGGLPYGSSYDYCKKTIACQNDFGGTVCPSNDLIAGCST